MKHAVVVIRPGRGAKLEVLAFGPYEEASDAMADIPQPYPRDTIVLAVELRSESKNYIALVAGAD
jgi:hypothetical protein